ncbi:MAG: hypothetical protein ACTSWY_15045 [Promethearchaeota archaeon]
MENQHDEEALNQYLACRAQLGLDLPIQDQFNLFIQRSLGIVALEIACVWAGASFIIFFLWGKGRNKSIKKI